MGLSNWERHHKIVWGIRSLTQLGKKINTRKLAEDLGPDFSDDSFLRIRRICLGLWGTFFAHKGNSGFWIEGSKEEVRSDGETIWEIALADNIKGCLKPDSDMNEADKVYKKIEKRKDSKFNAFDGFLDIEGILEGNNKTVYEIYKWCQQIQYAANRYKDDFSVKYKPVMDEVNSIMGEIFNIFHMEHEFAEAYMLNKICKNLYTEKYSWAGANKCDAVTKFLDEHHLHHDLRTSYKDFYAHKMHYLKQALKSLTEDDSLQNRAYWAAKLTAKKFSIVNDNTGKADKLRNRQREALIQLIDLKKWDKKKFMKVFKDGDEMKAKDIQERHKNYDKESKFYEKDLLED